MQIQKPDHSLKASKDLFAKISLIAQIRSLDMRSVFRYPLGPLPWSLAEAIGTLKKTSKASLLHQLEGKVSSIERISGRFALIVDGMAFVQQIKVVNITYSEFAMKLLERVLFTGKLASRIDVVFDEYRDVFIKNIERHRRSRGQLSFKQIVGSAEIKQFGLFLSSNENKNALIQFIVDQWKQDRCNSRIGADTEFFVTNKQKVYQINGKAFVEKIDLHSNHEEADTRMILHAQHAASLYEKVLIASPDTDVFVILIALHTFIDANIYFLTGAQNSKRIIDVNKVADQFMLSSNPCKVSMEMLMKSLIGIHSFTGCDTVSAFNGRGKVKPLNFMVKNVIYIEAFAEIGTSHQISDSLMKIIEKFVCGMYGGKIDSVDEMRYHLYCKSGGKLGCEYLPPCRDVLILHTKRANYQAMIWRQSLTQYQQDMNPQQHGWIVDEDGDLDIHWMKCRPAPDEAL